MKTNKIINKIELAKIDKLSEANLKELYGNYKSKYSSRMKIDTGFRCNAKCRYCYYLTKVNEEFIPKKEITDQINFAKKNKFKSIEFSGGESTIHPDFLDCISYAKSLGLITSVITNGYLTHQELKLIIDRGIDEIMFSIHGYQKTHDDIVKLKDAYENIISNARFIYNHHRPIKTRLNIIINTKNIFELDDIIDEIIDLHSLHLIKINQINFLPLNEWQDAKNIGKRSQDIIHKNIKIIENNMDKIINQKIELNIRYLEYCSLNEKYHKYLYNYLDQYFTNDWNPFFIYKEDIKNNTKPVSFNLEKIKEELKSKRETQYYKTKECVNCKFDIVCDGFKRQE